MRHAPAVGRMSKRVQSVRKRNQQRLGNARQVIEALT
jgi:hypothetical protein